MCNAESSSGTIKGKGKDKTDRICQGLFCSMLKKAYIIIRSIIDQLIDFVFGLYWNQYRQVLPNLDKEHKVLTLSATQLAKDIREGRLKSEDLVKACIDRIKQVNPILNAVTDQRYEKALEEAQEVDRRVKNGLSEEEVKRQPYLGVPFTAKESHGVQGLLFTWGLTARRNERAAEDAECVRLLRASGAIPVAVTNVPEVNKWQETNNMLFGLTNNPYNTGRTVGGSSGGEAALMAALATPIALCSDIGGSTRMPAFFCGLFGYNPTANVTSLQGSVSRSGKDDTMASIGFVSRHVEDLAPLTTVVAHPKAHLLNLEQPVDVKKLKFYYVETSKDLRLSAIRPELKMAMKKVLSKLTEQSSESTPPQKYYHEGFSNMFNLWRYWVTREKEEFANMLANKQGRVIGLLELVKKIFNRSDYTLAAIFKLLDDQILPKVDQQWAEQLTESLKEDLFKTLGEDGVLIFPSAPLPASPHYSCFLRPYNFSYWGIFNVLRCPSVQVPLGLNADGLPLGVQVVAPPQHDARALAVATYLATEMGGFVPPCRVP